MRRRRRARRSHWRVRLNWGEVGLAAVWVATTLSAGFYYRPYRSDWVLLGRAATWPHGIPWQFLVAHAFSSDRPLSLLVDVELLARFWPAATIPWAIIMAVMLVAVLMGRRLVERVTGQGFWLGAAIVLLFPAVVEGQYWITAASGIVLSLWLVVLGAWAAYLALQAAPRSAYGWWVASAVALLLADLCSEQVWLPSLLVLAALAWRGRSHWIRGVLPAAAALGATGAWYGVQAAALGAHGPHAVHTLAQFRHEARLVDPQLAALWLHTVWQGFGQAWQGLAAAPGLGVGGWWWIAVAGGTVMVVAAAIWPETTPPKGSHALGWASFGVAWGVLSVVPWYLTTGGFASARAATTTVVGVAFLAEAAVLLAVRAHPTAGRVAAGVLVAAMLLLGASLRAQDVQAYQQSGRLDASLMLTALAALHQEGIHGGVLVSYVEPVTWVPWDYYFGSHIESSLRSASALGAGLEDLSGGRDTFAVTSAQGGPPAHVPVGAVGIVVELAAPQASALGLAHTARGLVIQVSLLRGEPHIVQAAWFAAPPLSAGG